MDFDARAAAIAAMLQANDISFEFKGSGTGLNKRGRLLWDFVTVEAIHPDTEKRVALTSFVAASKFLLSVRRKQKK